MLQRWLYAPLCALVCWSAIPSSARAEQFVLVDLSYTHSSSTTNDSHYYPQLPDDRPKDWTAPVDYANGSVHIELDVKTKPAGNAPTKYQLCFEGTPDYACTLQSPTYTSTGHVEWDSPFDDFWYGGTVDWSKGVKQMPMILKDDNNNKPAGDPKYMPTDLHVLVVLVSAGDKYTPVSSGSDGAAGASGAASMEGVAGAAAEAGAKAMPSAGGSGVGAMAAETPTTTVAGVAGAGTAGTAAMTTTTTMPAIPRSAGSGAAGTLASGTSSRSDSPTAMLDMEAAAGAAGASSSTTSSDASGASGPSTSNESVDGSGCSATRGSRADGLWWLGVAAMWWRTRRRRGARRAL